MNTVNKNNRVPGRTGGELAHRLPRGLSGLRAAAVPDLRGCASTRSPSGDAELGMIPIENSVAGRVADIHHLMPTAGSAHRRRMVPADPQPADGAEGRDARGTEVGREPRHGARPVPQLPAQARRQDHGRGRHRRRRARGRRARRQEPAPRSPRRSPPRSTASTSWRREHRGRVALDHALHRAVARGRWAPPRQRAGHHHLRVRGAQRAGGALQGARAASPPTAST